jgi:hypothetical protein
VALAGRNEQSSREGWSELGEKAQRLAGLVLIISYCFVKAYFGRQEVKGVRRLLLV